MSTAQTPAPNGSQVADYLKAQASSNAARLPQAMVTVQRLYPSLTQIPVTGSKLHWNGKDFKLSPQTLATVLKVTDVAARLNVGEPIGQIAIIAMADALDIENAKQPTGEVSDLVGADTPDEMMAEIARLRAENAKLQAAKVAAGKLSWKLGQSGAVSVYGLGRWPMTLYSEQWKRLAESMPGILKYIATNPVEDIDEKDERGVKTGRMIRVAMKIEKDKK